MLSEDERGEPGVELLGDGVVTPSFESDEVVEVGITADAVMGAEDEEDAAALLAVAAAAAAADLLAASFRAAEIARAVESVLAETPGVEEAAAVAAAAGGTIEAALSAAATVFSFFGGAKAFWLHCPCNRWYLSPFICLYALSQPGD
jgi:hypothetical protein